MGLETNQGPECLVNILDRVQPGSDLATALEGLTEVGEPYKTPRGMLKRYVSCGVCDLAGGIIGDGDKVNSVRNPRPVCPFPNKPDLDGGSNIVSINSLRDRKFQ